MNSIIISELNMKSNMWHIQGRVKEIRVPLHLEISGPPAYPAPYARKLGGVIRDLSQG